MSGNNAARRGDKRALSGGPATKTCANVDTYEPTTEATKSSHERQPDRTDGVQSDTPTEPFPGVKS